MSAVPTNALQVASRSSREVFLWMGMGCVMFHCDRCHQDKEGWIGPIGSAGCYVVADADGPLYWAKYAERRPDEMVICDACMWATKTYQRTYGKMN